jgi:hypothetical protein
LKTEPCENEKGEDDEVTEEVASSSNLSLDFPGGVRGSVSNVKLVVVVAPESAGASNLPCSIPDDDDAAIVPPLAATLPQAAHPNHNCTLLHKPTNPKMRASFTNWMIPPPLSFSNQRWDHYKPTTTATARQRTRKNRDK